MIRVGRYTAHDKWDTVCRFWSDPNSVTDPNSGRRGTPSLREWHAAAFIGGQKTVSSHITMLSALGPGDRVVPDDSEILRVIGESGVDRMISMAGQLIDSIRGRGYQASFAGDLPPLAANRLREVFKGGALKYLSWTLDVDEVPSIEDIQLKANIFPTDAIEAKKNVLCLFCALFYGRADVIHVYDAAPKTATLVDNLSEHLENMKLIYPLNWEFVSADYEVFLAEASQSPKTYDLIISDHSTEMARKVLWDYLPVIMNLCSDTLIGNYLRDMILELGVQPDDLAGLSRAVSRKTGVDVTFSQMLERGPNYGVYWAVMHKIGNAIRV
jgi:hypothetical protein